MSDYFTGSEWSQTYAKKAMPVLVNSAENRRFLTYTELASVLLNDKKYAYSLMSALGRLGEALKSLSLAEPKKFSGVPPIQLLVCNRKTRRPGNLALNFLNLRKSLTDRMSRQELDSVVQVTHQRIFSYPHWPDVLTALGVKPFTLKLPATGDVLPKVLEIERRSTAEGEEHRRLKLFLARNPKQIGIQWNGTGETEQLLLSGDRLDVSFRNHEKWIAVEVKGKQSPVADLIRGIFQCVKYKAILAAQIRYEALEGQAFTGQKTLRVILVCGATLPEELRKLAESLDVEVRLGISVPEKFIP